MKIRVMFVLVMALVLSLSLTYAQKAACDTKATAGMSCCKQGVKADKAVNTTESAHATIMFASNKKSAKASAECSDAEKAACMASTKCTAAEKAACMANKASMTKVNSKMDCCKDKAKMTKAEKKSQSDKTDAKGTN